VSNGLVKWFLVKWVWDGQRELLVGFIWLTGVLGLFLVGGYCFLLAQAIGVPPTRPFG
jgi:hypothetical protein